MILSARSLRSLAYIIGQVNVSERIMHAKRDFLVFVTGNSSGLKWQVLLSVIGNSLRSLARAYYKLSDLFLKGLCMASAHFCYLETIIAVI